MTDYYTPGLLTDIYEGSVAYRSSYTLSLTDIPVYTPGDKPLYPRLLNNILGNSVALSPTDISVYTLGDMLLYPWLLTDTPVYSVAYKSWCTLSLTNIPVYSPCDRPLYPGLLTLTPSNSVADRSLYTLLLIQVYLSITVNYQQTVRLHPVTLSRT